MDSCYRGSGTKLEKLPKELLGKHFCFGLSTHPIDRNLLLFPTKEANFFYASDDAGKSLKRITSPVDYKVKVSSLFELCYCHFAVSSKESTLEPNGIHCIYETTYFQNQQKTLRSTPFYTTDFGKSTKVFDELNCLYVRHTLIFPSSVFVLISGDRFKASELWISKGKSFEPLCLPKEVISLKMCVSLDMV